MVNVMHIGKWTVTIKDFVWFAICLILVLCFFIGLFIDDNGCASDILSGASTAVSIVLSIVAILYTMIEGANSSEVNQEAKNKLANIDNQLKEVTQKLTELKELDKRIRYVVPKLDTAVQEIEKASNNSGDKTVDEDVKQNLQYLIKYINEDIDE